MEKNGLEHDERAAKCPSSTAFWKCRRLGFYFITILKIFINYYLLILFIYHLIIFKKMMIPSHSRSKISEQGRKRSDFDLYQKESNYMSK